MLPLLAGLLGPVLGGAVASGGIGGLAGLGGMAAPAAGSALGMLNAGAAPGMAGWAAEGLGQLGASGGIMGELGVDPNSRSGRLLTAAGKANMSPKEIKDLADNPPPALDGGLMSAGLQSGNMPQTPGMGDLMSMAMNYNKYEPYEDIIKRKMGGY